MRPDGHMLLLKLGDGHMGFIVQFPVLSHMFEHFSILLNIFENFQVLFKRQAKNSILFILGKWLKEKRLLEIQQYFKRDMKFGSMYIWLFPIVVLVF